MAYTNPLTRLGPRLGRPAGRPLHIGARAPASGSRVVAAIEFLPHPKTPRSVACRVMLVAENPQGGPMTVAGDANRDEQLSLPDKPKQPLTWDHAGSEGRRDDFPKL